MRKVGAWRSLSDGGIPLGRLPRQQEEQAERAVAPLPRLSGAAGADLSGLAETMVEQAERAGASLPRFSGLAKTIVDQSEQVEPAEQATRAGAPIAASPGGGRRRAESPRRSVFQRLHNVQQ